MGATEFRFDRTWQFGLPPEQLWGVLGQTNEFPHWWTWLREFDAPGIRTGALAHLVIQAPLPYALHLEVYVERAERPSLVDTRVRGDLDGSARLEIEPTDGGAGSAARLVWDLDVRDRMLRQVARVSRPLMVWAHDRVVATGVEQFRRRALDGTGSPHRDHGND
jgi:hypothetical protein